MWTHLRENRYVKKYMLGGETKSSLVKAAAGKELAARGECHTVHRLLMPAEDRSGSKCRKATLLVRVEYDEQSAC